MWLASKISLTILVVGLVAFVAVTTLDSTTSASSRRALADLTSKLNLLDPTDHVEEDAVALEKPLLSLRHPDSVAESVKDDVEETEDSGDSGSLDDSSPKEQDSKAKRIKGSSQRGLYWNYPPPPPPKPKYPPYRPPPPRYPPPMPKYYSPPPPPRPSCPGGYGVTYYTCSYCPCRWNEHKFNIYGCGCGCILDN